MASADVDPAFEKEQSLRIIWPSACGFCGMIFSAALTPDRIKVRRHAAYCVGPSVFFFFFFFNPHILRPSLQKMPQRKPLPLVCEQATPSPFFFLLYKSASCPPGQSRVGGLWPQRIMYVVPLTHWARVCNPTQVTKQEMNRKKTYTKMCLHSYKMNLDVGMLIVPLKRWGEKKTVKCR